MNADLRHWCEWATNYVWAGPANLDTAREMFVADPERIRRAAAHLRATFPFPWLLTPTKLYHGFRHENPKLKVLKPSAWLDARGRPALLRSFTELLDGAQVYAYDQQAVDEYLATFHARGVEQVNVEHDSETLEPKGIPDPWGHGYIAVLGRNWPQDSLLCHWRYFYEHPLVMPRLHDLSLQPRMPRTFCENEGVYVFLCSGFEYVLDVERLPAMNVMPYRNTPQNRMRHRHVALAAEKFVRAVAAGRLPGPSPAFPNPSIQ